MTGITENIKTLETKTRVIDVINSISKKKYNAMKMFLEGEEFKEAVVFGVYLWGNYVAQNIKNFCDKVYLVDIYEFLKDLIPNDNIEFLTLNDFKLKLIKDKINPDLVIDITGLGGIDPNFLKKFSPKIAIIEDPRGVFDPDIYELDNTYKRAYSINSEKVGILKTFRKAKISKTSGTMTLTIDTIVDASKEISSLDGVLYAIPNLKYYEGILFHNGNIKRFLLELSKPAIIISSINDVINEAEKIIENNLNLIYSFIDEL
ncbi:hypothetical protein J422_05933 [Methanocaldococcus villosus KIN24-T80]|uniref:Uncharacterized protein n=2 Tax=Methanocaldococcus villosus TaxID=667126 RepID=N6VPG1_9EURY|nr:hypothetical protein J422_05933 [Methanocaldococcus villosus KIN24-T80]